MVSPKKIIITAIAIAATTTAVWYAKQHLLCMNNQWIYVERADTPATQELGLGDRDSLCGHCGMLFDFEKPGRYAFWMKGMHFPLDILWIADSRVIFIRKNIPANNQDAFTPPADADRVLEINAGKADEWGIFAGSHVW
jgi:uncharacterized membrane protein (UPF0127 family)